MFYLKIHQFMKTLYMIYLQRLMVQTLIEDNRDGKFELILNAHQITSDEESLIKKTLSKVSNYKSSLGSAFVQWFQLFHAEYIKDIDSSVQKLLNILKRLRG